MNLENELIIDLGSVKARVSYIAPNGISAIITEPEKYFGIRVNSPHIPYFAMPDRAGWFSIKGKITKKGIESISESLKETFHVLEVFDANKREIKEFYNAIPEQVKSDGHKLWNRMTEVAGRFNMSLNIETYNLIIELIKK